MSATGRGGAREGKRMRARAQLVGSMVLAVIVLVTGAPFAETGSALVAGPSTSTGPLGQAGTPLCGVPSRATQVPERSAELRLVRDADGVYWQIQSGCRHLVEPFHMDTATLNVLPQGEDVSYVTFGQPAPVPTPSALDLPAYARLPAELLPPPAPAPAPPAPSDAPGALDRYQNRVLVIDPSMPNVIYLLQGGLRHRVMLYYPLDVALNDIDASRAGDLASYALRGVSGLVATIADVPWGERAPYYGWGTGESVVVSDRVGAPDAVNCTQATSGTPGPVAGPLGAAAAATVGPTLPLRSLVACQRFNAAQLVNASAYTGNPGRYAGRDLRLVSGVACSVRYNAARDGKTFQYTSGDTSVPALAPGAQAQSDPNFHTGRVLEIGVFAPTVTETSGASTSGELIVFAYLPSGGAPCPSSGGR